MDKSLTASVNCTASMEPSITLLLSRQKMSNKDKMDLKTLTYREGDIFALFCVEKYLIKNGFNEVVTELHPSLGSSRRRYGICFAKMA